MSEQSELKGTGICQNLLCNISFLWGDRDEKLALKKYRFRSPFRFALLIMRQMRTFVRAQTGDKSLYGLKCVAIIQAVKPGVQGMNADDEWIEASPVPEAFVMNIGDMPGAIINERLIATPGRGLTAGKESLAAFLPELVGEGEVPVQACYVASYHIAVKIMRRLNIRRLVDEGGARSANAAGKV